MVQRKSDFAEDKKALLPTSQFEDENIHFPPTARKCRYQGKFKKLAACVVGAVVSGGLAIAGVHRLSPWVAEAILRYQDSTDIPLRFDALLGACINWNVDAAGQMASGELVMDLGKEFMFMTYGKAASGDVVFNHDGVTFLEDAEASPDDKVRAKVFARFEDKKYLEYFKVCERIGRSSSDNPGFVSQGVNIMSVPYVPSVKGHLTVHIMLPKTDEANMCNPRLNALVSASDTFQPTFNDLSKLPVRSISINPGEKVVRAKALVAEDIYVTGKGESSIEGDFSATKGVSLRTESGTILAKVHLGSPPNLECPVPAFPTARIVTQTGPIQAQFNLTSGYTKTEGGTFNVGATSRRGDISLDFIDETPNSHLFVDANSPRGDVSVSVDPVFVGSFQLNNLLPLRTVHDTRLELGGDYPKDPTGADRPRGLWENYKGLMRHDGAVVWGRGGQDNGLVKLSTTTGHAKFTF